MAHSRKKLQKILLAAEVLLCLFCLAVYMVDYGWGDGDGIIEKAGLNPVTIFCLGQLFLLPLLGMTTSREYLVNGSLLLFSLLLGGVLLEIAMRIFPIRPAASSRLENLGTGPIFSRYDTVYFKNYMPNAHFVTHINEQDSSWSIANSVNSLGVRGPEIAAKQPGERRLLLLGDSFLQSDEVAYENSIGQQLQTLLGDSNSVIQHGNPSWSPLLELNWLLRQGPGLALDQVILFLYYNDFFPGRSVGDRGYVPFTRFDALGYPRGFNFDSVKGGGKRSAWTQFWEQLGYLKTWRWLKSWRQQRRLHHRIPADQVARFLQMPPEAFLQTTTRSDLQNDLLEAKLWGLMATLRDNRSLGSGDPPTAGFVGALCTVDAPLALRPGYRFGHCPDSQSLAICRRKRSRPQLLRPGRDRLAPGRIRGSTTAFLRSKSDSLLSFVSSFCRLQGEV